MLHKEIQVFKGFQAAQDADDLYYARLSRQERVDILLALIAAHREQLGETAERFENVYRVTQRKKS